VTAIVQVEQLARSFGGVRAVDGVSFVVAEGTSFGVIGPNGAGKTTLFGLLSGDIKPSGGQIRLFGQDVTRWGVPRRTALGVARTFQTPRGFPNLTVRENITLAASGHARSKYALLRPWRSYRATARLVADTADRFGFGSRLDRLATHLSHGELRQLDIMLALVANPRLLLLDEPAAGLPAAERRQVTEMLQQVAPELTLLIIEHDMEIVRNVVDEVMVMHHGQVIATGPPDVIRTDKTVQDVYLGAFGRRVTEGDADGGH
jgi:branched-chain amino acid transport system ATP-binding protein